MKYIGHGSKNQRLSLLFTVMFIKVFIVLTSFSLYQDTEPFCGLFDCFIDFLSRY